MKNIDFQRVLIWILGLAAICVSTPVFASGAEEPFEIGLGAGAFVGLLFLGLLFLVALGWQKLKSFLRYYGDRIGPSVILLMLSLPSEVWANPWTEAGPSIPYPNPDNPDAVFYTFFGFFCMAPLFMLIAFCMRGILPEPPKPKKRSKPPDQKEGPGVFFMYSFQSCKLLVS